MGVSVPDIRVVAYVGSRDMRPGWTTLIDKCVSRHDKDRTLVVSGGATGVDSIAITAATLHGLHTAVIDALWGPLGKRAGYVRNQFVVAIVDLVVAFWDGESKGTKHTIDLARKAGVEVVVFGPDCKRMRHVKEPDPLNDGAGHREGDEDTTVAALLGSGE